MYLLKWQATIVWAPDGAQSETVGNAQALTVSQDGGTSVAQTSPILVPGGNAPSGANLTTAAVAAGVLIGAALNANLAAIQGWSSGGD